jgi:immune inhibitor A
MSRTSLLKNYRRIRAAAAASEDGGRCMVSPAPELREKIKKELASLRNKKDSILTSRLRAVAPTRLGFNDGVIIPPEEYALGTPISRIRAAAAERAPLAGVVRVIVVLVDFDDKPMTQSQNHFKDLFFSQGVLATKSVREYFTEVTNGIIDIQGDVVGPFRMPKKLSEYAHGDSGTGLAQPNAQTMARDAVLASNPTVNFGPFDNDGNGFVDAFIVLHAGSGAEQTGSTGDIWSHKWTLAGGSMSVDTTKIFGYLTVPEDSKIGVCCHELGHLLFGFPDLYDTDDSSEGIGNWCLMAGGSWGGGGDTPCHPSAWCKANQGWATVENRTSNGSVSVADVKDAHKVYRLWKDGAAGTEYFLVENRQKKMFDTSLPAGGLLIWHIDESVSGNTNEAHYKVALMQADGKKDMENGTNRGDAGDCYPGTSNNSAFNNTSTPNSKSYTNASTCVAVTSIPASSAVMSVNMQVKCAKSKKEISPDKLIKKEWFSEKWLWEKSILSDKKPEKPVIDKSQGFDKGFFEKPGEGKFTEGGLGGWLFGGQGSGPQGSVPQGAGAQGSDVEARLAAIEAALQRLLGTAMLGSAAPQPFIGRELRPDLSEGALGCEDDYGKRGPTQIEGGPQKRQFDSKPPEM